MAVNCMCRNGPFEARLENAYANALVGLTPSDAPAELAGDLEWVLQLCERNHVGAARGKAVPVAEADQAKLREKLLRLLVKTTQLTTPGGRR